MGGQSPQDVWGHLPVPGLLAAADHSLCGLTLGASTTWAKSVRQSRAQPPNAHVAPGSEFTVGGPGLSPSTRPGSAPLTHAAASQATSVTDACTAPSPARPPARPLRGVAASAVLCLALSLRAVAGLAAVSPSPAMNIFIRVSR